MSSKIKTYNPKEVIVTCGTHICWIVLGGDFSDVVTQWHPMGR